MENNLKYVYRPGAKANIGLIHGENGRKWIFLKSYKYLEQSNILFLNYEPFAGNRNKGKGNGAGLAWESQSHCFADKFGITHAHSFGTDTQHDYSQGNFFRVLISK